MVSGETSGIYSAISAASLKITMYFALSALMACNASKVTEVTFAACTRESQPFSPLSGVPSDNAHGSEALALPSLATALVVIGPWLSCTMPHEGETVSLFVLCFSPLAYGSLTTTMPRSKVGETGETMRSHHCPLLLFALAPSSLT